jgi:hypothetical protein
VLPTTVAALSVAVALSVLVLPGILATVLSAVLSPLLVCFAAALLSRFHRDRADDAGRGDPGPRRR